MEYNKIVCKTFTKISFEENLKMLTKILFILQAFRFL